MADLILKVTSEEVRNKAQEISTQRELLEGYMQEMQNQVTVSYTHLDVYKRQGYQQLFYKNRRKIQKRVSVR